MLCTVKLHGAVRHDGPVIVTTVVPVGSQSTHMICPHCYREITTSTKNEPGIIAYISGIVIALLGYVTLFTVQIVAFMYNQI